MYIKSILITLVTIISFGASAADAVKKSSSGICHTTQSAWYEKTKNFQPFDTLQACLDSGGRLPKSYSGNTQPSNSQSYSSGRYDRDSFGGWADFDNDGVDTRGELLIEKSLSEVKMNSGYEYVISGRWYDPYTDQHFTDASDVHIDHIVAVYYLHKTGVTNNMTPQEKAAFYNDPENLLIVSASENMTKGADGPSSYLPPNDKFHCPYTEQFVYILKKYDAPAQHIERASAVKERECN